MGVITTSSFAKALWPGINKWYGQAYDKHPTEWNKLVETYNSSKAWEEDVGVTSFGLASAKSEGLSIAYDDMSQGFLTRYTHVVYGLGFVITREMYEDDQYDVIGRKRANALAFSMQQTKEIVVANVYNNAFSSTYVGGDGKELCATDHPNASGGTWANEPSTNADLSEASLEQSVIDIGKWTNDRGLKISIMPQSLIIPVDLAFEAERILMSPHRVGTSDNDINALYRMGKFPGGIIVNHYLTDTDAWFIRTNAPDGLKLFQRRAMQFGTDNDFDTENAKYKATERYSVGWTDPRSIYGCTGA
jgi:phage major head subunit gpT-like protein